MRWKVLCLVVVCLALGLGVGWLIGSHHRSRSDQELQELNALREENRQLKADKQSLQEHSKKQLQIVFDSLEQMAKKAAADSQDKMIDQMTDRLMEAAREDSRKMELQMLEEQMLKRHGKKK